MKFYVKALTEIGRLALQQHLDDTENLDKAEKVKGKVLVKHKVVNRDPLTIMMKPRKVTILAAKITPGLYKFKLDYIEQMNTTLQENGATKEDYQLWVEGHR